MHILASSLTPAVRSSRASGPHCGIARKRYLTVLVGLCVFTAMSMQYVKANTPDKEAYMLYAHFKLGNDKQYRCLVTLWHAESRWSPTANNQRSSAYGIPQLLKMTERNPYRQIDLGIKYIAHRHKSACRALAYHDRHGHY